jgi:manganese transport system permease protein
MTEASDVPVLDFLLEPLGYDFMQRAFLITITAAIVCGVLSCWLVLIGWSLMGDAVSHAVLPGVVLAYLLGTPFALGLVLISVVPSQTDLGHILFGNLLGVSVADLVQVLVLGAVTLAILVLKRRDLTLYAFDPTHAHAIGLNQRALGALLLGLLALTVVVALQAVGVVLVVAMVIIPGATAYLLTDRFARMLVIAPSIAAASAIIGIYASYYLDAASGGMVVLTMGVAFALAYLFAPRHGVIGRRLAAARRRRAGAAADRRAAEPASAR